MHVLISGAGIAGPTLAWFLAKAGIRTTIVEKAPSLLAQGQNIDIQGSAVSIAQKMGLLEEIRKNNSTEQGTQFIGSNGRPYAKFPINEGSTASMTSEYEILRGDLATILYNATKDHPLVNYIFGNVISKVISNDEQAVKVEFENEETQQYDLLVVADGQWSKLRKQCFPAENLTVIDKGLYTAWWTIPRIASDNNWWNVYFGLNSKGMTLRPDPHGTIRAAMSCMPCNSVQASTWRAASRKDRKTQQELIRQEFANVGWQAERLLEGMMQAPDFYFQSVQQIKLSKWSQSRVVCLGDAAYAPTPLTGMGTSLAINGAYVLAGELSRLQKGEHISVALESYERTFRPFVEQSQKMPSFVPGVAHPETPLKRWLLQQGIWVVSIAIATAAKIPWLSSMVQKPEGEDFPLPRYDAFEVAKVDQ